MPSQTKENYLKAIYFLADAAGRIAVSDLSRQMGVSTPTANSMVKRLQEQGWVVYEKYKPLQLTEHGRRTAALIIRKHRLAEMYLVERMGFGWEEVHDIAEDMEHIQSEALFDRMDALLGYPEHDPHGSPIPDKQGNVVPQTYRRLSEVEAGETCFLRALTQSSSEFLVFLNGKELELGTRITVVEKEPFDQSLTVSYGQRTSVTLSREVCERLLVESTGSSN